MGRKAKSTEETPTIETPKDNSDAVFKMIEKDYGEGIIVSARTMLDTEQVIIPVSPAMNVGFNGGVPQGSWFTIAGKYKCGKSSLALHFASKCQKYGMEVHYLNIEGRLKKMNLDSVPELDLDKFYIVGSTEDRIMSSQDYLGTAEKLLLSKKNILLIIDSCSALCHEKELTDGIGTSTRGGGAALLAQFTRQMSNVVPIKNHIVIGITQLMANTSGYGAAVMEKGGNAIQYQTDVKIRCKSVEPWENTEGKRIGQLVTWMVECTALGAPPGVEIVSYLRYGSGIDEISEAIVLGSSLGLINKAGAWYTLDYMQHHLEEAGLTEWNDETKKEFKSQGQEKMYELLKQNPRWIEILDQEIQKLFK